MEMGGQLHAPAALPPGTYWRVGWELFNKPFSFREAMGYVSMANIFLNFPEIIFPVFF
jgi:hypothetical protein